MNLAPITKKEQETRVLHTREKPFYPDCMLEGSTKEVKSGCVKIDLKDSEILTQIGKPGFLKGEYYFDFCVFFEKPLFDNKEKKEANKKEMFHHFDKSITIYKKGEKRKAQSRKFYWPTETKADITAYTDDNEIIYEYRINKIRPIIETSIAKENIDYEIIGDTQIKILKTDNLYLSYKKIRETEFILKDIINKTFEKTNVNGKPAFYITSENFEEITIWTKEGNLIEKGAREVEVYEKNPLVYKYEEVTKDEEIYKHIIGIDSNKIETDNLEGKVVKVKTDNNLKLYIKEEDKQKCMRSIYDWESWFFKLNELELNKSDIVCDRTIFTEIAIKAHNQAVENEELYEEKLEKWWYGSYLVDEYLKGIYGSNDKYEFAKSMRLQFMKATCKHPIEWDKRLFNCEKIEKDYREITNAVLNESIKNKLIKESEKSDIWEKGLSKVFKKNNFYFVNPVYFLNHLENAGLLEFNPYEGKIFEDVYGFIKPAPKINMAQLIIDNPGFATEYVYGVGEKNPNSNNFGAVTGFFNEYYPKQGPNYYHEGVDFRGTVGTRIKCLIHAKVIAYGWMPDSGYGQVVWLYNVDGEGIYLLAHLNSYDSKIAVGKEYFPGETVAYVGGSGRGKMNMWDPHLHLSYHKKKYDKNFIQQKTITMINNNVILGNGYSMIREARRDPFNHNSEGHKGFGR
jgi:murein DD-endopeptidase MepM/ murein hydrolase activator NlpD